MKCPGCGRSSGAIYQCDQCGDIRCGQSGCTGTQGGSKGPAGNKGKCRACKQGKYKPLK